MDTAQHPDLGVNGLTLAVRLFIDPLDLHAWWWVLLVPMAWFLSMAYKAVRVPTLDDYWRQVTSMAVQVVLAMVALSVAAFLIIELFVQRMAG